jgi:Flp pilus assembly pilin Flp
MESLLKVARDVGRDDKGATMAEYVLLVGFIALLAVVGASILGGGLSTIYGSVGSAVSQVIAPGLPSA